MTRDMLPCAVLALLGGCTVGPAYHPPQAALPAHWHQAVAGSLAATTEADTDAAWWQRFKDPELSSLIGRLARQNLDLQLAAERILQGQAERDAVVSQGLPRLAASSSDARFRYSPIGNPLALVVPRPGAQPAFDVFQNGLSASWELDLFGRVRRGVEAAEAGTEAAVEARNEAALALSAELASDYMSLRGDQAQLRIAEDNLALAGKTTSLVRSQVAHGTATTLELSQAEAQQEDIAQTLPPLRAQQVSLIDAIGFLLGEQPDALAAELRWPRELPAIPTFIAVGRPVSLVRRRPDLRRAEANLHMAVAETGVAAAEFYPDVSLAGSFALNSLELKDAFRLASRTFEVGPSVSLPIFEGGRLRATLALRRSQQREAMIAFRRTVLQALSEVEDALTAFADAQDRLDHATRGAAFAQEALNAARLRYVHGAADFLNVTSAQAALLRDQSRVAASRTELATDLVALYRSLGGGWQIVAPSDPSSG